MAFLESGKFKEAWEFFKLIKEFGTKIDRNNLRMQIKKLIINQIRNFQNYAFQVNNVKPSKIIETSYFKLLDCVVCLLELASHDLKMKIQKFTPVFLSVKKEFMSAYPDKSLLLRIEFLKKREESENTIPAIPQHQITLFQPAASATQTNVKDNKDQPAP